jgi:anti-anti-sigma factor
MALDVRPAGEDGTEIVRIAGDVDVSTVDAVERRLLGAVSAGVPPAPVVVDFSAVTFMGSCGLGLLRSIHEIAQSQGTPLRIVAPQRAVRRPVRLLGFDRTLRLYYSMEDAARRY